VRDTYTVSLSRLNSMINMPILISRVRTDVLVSCNARASVDCEALPAVGIQRRAHGRHVQACTVEPSSSIADFGERIEPEGLAMRFTLTVELGDDAIETGADLAELLVRIAPTVERCVGPDLADCIGTVRDLDGQTVGKWTCIEPQMPGTTEPAPTSSDTTHKTVREINSDSWKTYIEPETPEAMSDNSEHLTVREINKLLDGSRACYVNIGSERIRIRHARKVNGQMQGKLVNRPSEWITIPPGARVELLD
jgi:hypothetical protein